MSSSTKTYTSRLPGMTSGPLLTQRYKIIEELGSGGMGTVYKVEDREIEEVIALKLLRREIADDEKHIRRFQNELKVARKIIHKNVCQMYYFGHDNSSYFITMEYVTGADLKSILHMMGQTSAGKAIRIAKQICLGLAEAHSLGVIHRDLKPQNIMIDKDGNAKIMDFGIARSTHVRGLTLTGVLIGTPEYMSPEQVEGRTVDPRSDIYSLGIILYELLIGFSPFAGKNPVAVALKQKNETPPEPRKINPQIPGSLNTVILKCLKKDPEKRYASALDLLSDLTEIEKDLPNTTWIKSPQKPLRTLKPGKRADPGKHRLPKMLLLAHGALLLLGLCAAFKPSGDKRE